METVLTSSDSQPPDQSQAHNTQSIDITRTSHPHNTDFIVTSGNILILRDPLSGACIAFELTTKCFKQCNLARIEL